MTRLIVITFLSFLTLMGSGCASVVSLISEGGLDQEITFNSDPPGAQILLNGAVPLGVTPITVKIERSKVTYVVVKKEGYEDQPVHLRHHFNYWFWGNIICCGLLGSTTDFADDAVVEYDPDQHFVTMTQKEASVEQRRHHARTKMARNLMLVGHPHIQHDLATGEGEYVAIILAVFGIPDAAKPAAIDRLKILSSQSQNPPEFAEKVLKAFNLPNL